MSCHYVGCHSATLPQFHAHFQRAFASLIEFHLTEGRARSEIVSSSQVHLFMLR